MKYLSICSGIEAATQAWHPLGWKPVAFSEIEPFPCAVLAHHYPDVPNWGDMTKFERWPDAEVDVLCGGTPCQDYSVAGKRAGMAGERGNLTLTFVEIAARFKPKWIVWENVPGVLSSNGGRDFAAFLRDLGECGYGWAYRVLDAQFTRTCRFPHAVPQRRRRVFVVAYLGDWRRAAAVLFDRESLQWNPPPRREAGSSVAALTANGVGTCGADDNQGQAGHLIASTGDVAHCLNAGGMGRQDYESETMVAHTLRGEGFDASEDGTGRGTPVVAIQERAVSENPDAGPDGIGVRQDGASYTLEARSTVQAVSFSENQQGLLRTSDVAAQLTTGGGKPGQGYPAIAFDLRGRDGGAMPESVGQTDSLRAADGGSSRSYVAQPWAVRRLTPVECERLMAFPDNFTRIPYRGKPADKCPDGPRYKALGNSWAVNCAEWIGERIAMVEKL